MKYTCPCCGYKTLDEEPPGTYAICLLCFWEDDGVQFDDPDYRGGANSLSLRESQQNFLTDGACDERCRAFVRLPEAADVKDPDWKPLPPLETAHRALPQASEHVIHLPGPVAEDWRPIEQQGR